MEDSKDSGLRPRKPLTKRECRTLDRDIANRVIEVCGRLDEAGVTKGIGKLLEFVGAPADGYPATLPDRWVFPSAAYRRASEHVSRIVQAARGHDTSSLRLVTLRFGERKPHTVDIDGHLADMSKAINLHVDYLARRGLAQPILSVMQIGKADLSDGYYMTLDPHLHGIWDIAPEHIEEVRSYLEDDRFAQVWIDEHPVKSLKNAVFYICSGMLDYRSLPGWADDAIEALWNMSRQRMIRPAGWYAKAIRAKNSEPATPTQRGDGPKIDLDATASGLSMRLGAKRQKASQGLQIGLNPIDRQTPAARQRRPRGERSATSTVHALPTESTDLGKTPTISQLWFVRQVINARLIGKPAWSFQAHCAELGIPLADGYLAARITEASFKTTLFYPGDEWIPTEAAVMFKDRAQPLLEGFDHLYRDFRAEARAARDRLSRRQEPSPVITGHVDEGSNG